MTNAVLRIFRKDARRLWPQCAVAAAMTALAAMNNVIHPNDHGMWQRFPQLLAPLAVWALAIAVVHEERLVGNNQYWLARPYSWKTLLAAKALFLAVFINVPVFIFQCMAVEMAGLSPLDWVSALLWRQVFFTIFFILPAVAMGAVTKNLGQVVIAAVAGYVGLATGISLIGGQEPDWGNLGWMKECGAALVMLAGTAAVIAFQYARRRTTLAAALLGGVFVLSLAAIFTPVWGSAFGIQELFSKEPGLGAQVRLRVDESRVDRTVAV